MGGRPRFDINKGIFTCPGFHDDEHFRRCGKIYHRRVIKRKMGRLII